MWKLLLLTCLHDILLLPCVPESQTRGVVPVWNELVWNGFFCPECPSRLKKNTTTTLYTGYLEFKKFASVGDFQASLITVCLAQLAEGFFCVGDINTSLRTGRGSYALIFFSWTGNQSRLTVYSSRLNGWMFQRTGKHVVRMVKCFEQTKEQAVRCVFPLLSGWSRSFERMQISFKQFLNSFQTASNSF